MSEAALSGLSLWVTRPEPENERSVAFWRTHGAAAIAVPLLEVATLPVSNEEIERLDAALPEHVVFSSARAVEQLLTALEHRHDLLRRLRALPAWCVGDRTTLAAREAGFEQLRENPGSSAGDLAAHMRGNIAAAETVFFPAAAQRRPELPEILGSAGVSLVEWSVYDTVPLPLSDPRRESELQSETPPLLLAYSPTASAAIAAVLGESRAPVATLGGSTRTAAEEAGLRVVAHAATPRETALFEAVAGWWSEWARDRR